MLLIFILPLFAAAALVLEPLALHNLLYTCEMAVVPGCNSGAAVRGRLATPASILAHLSG